MNRYTITWGGSTHIVHASNPRVALNYGFEAMGFDRLELLTNQTVAANVVITNVGRVSRWREVVWRTCHMTSVQHCASFHDGDETGKFETLDTGGSVYRLDSEPREEGLIPFKESRWVWHEQRHRPATN